MAHEVEFEDLPEEPKDSGSGTTGYNGNGDPIPIDASCDKKGVISLMVMGGQMSLTMKCDRCPTIAPDPF